MLENFRRVETEPESPRDGPGPKAPQVLFSEGICGEGAAPGEVEPERSEVLCPSCGPPALKLIDVVQSRNMGPSKKVPRPPKRPLANVDAWSIRLLVILQAIAVIAALLAGSSLKEIGAISEGTLKILELLARAG